MTPAGGTTIAHYRILEKLGSGGMGVVYTAHDSVLNRTVALKFLPVHLSDNPREKQRFLREAQAASQLDHPNIGVVHEIGETLDGQMYIVMAFYEGETLKAKIARANDPDETVKPGVPLGLPVAEAVDLALQIAGGLAYAHEHAIVHRDIKPGNIVITQNAIAKIIDFGLAKLVDPAETATATGISKGTPAYMSPEQAAGRDVDARTDVWSLGVVLYEMLTGKLPFRGHHQPAQIQAILQEEPEPIRKLRPDVPNDIDRVVARAMEKETARRYASAAEMLQALAACQISLPVRSAAPVAIESWRRARVAIPAAVLLLALAAAGAIFVRRSVNARWARERALPEIARLGREGKIMAAYRLSQEAQRYIPSDPELTRLSPEISAT